MSERNSNYIVIYKEDPVDLPDYLYWRLSCPLFLFSSSLPYEDFVALLDSALHEPYSLLELQHPFRSIRVQNRNAYELAMLDSFGHSLPLLNIDPKSTE